MSIERLIEIMPVDFEPFEAVDQVWSNFEDQLGRSWPDDYKIFLNRYGTGQIGNFLWILNPFAKNPNIGLEKILYFQNSYKKMREIFPGYYSRNTFPEKNSFLTWAVTDNGESIFWEVNSEEPDKWNVGVHSVDQGEEEIFEMKMLEFLCNLVEKKIESAILPRKFLYSEKKFVPYNVV